MKLQDQTPAEFVNMILKTALEKEASDIYVLPGNEKCEIRLRTHGIQQPLTELPTEEAEHVINRLKVLGEIQTFTTNTAQDGAFEFADTSFRIASMPTMHGERLTIRILKKANNLMNLDDLGYNDATTDSLKRMLIPEQGLILLTGSTGSGKTTVMYAMLRELLKNKQDPASIISIEDPVECEIPEISQTEIDSQNWSYDEALKAALRQDVKTLLIGELRDKGVAKTALNAAVSGHRIIATFHAGSIAGIYARLLNYGFEPFLIAAAISACVNMTLEYDEKLKVYKPKAEYLEVDNDWRDLILKKPTLKEIGESIKA